MMLVAPRNALAVLARLLTAAVLVAIVSVGAPLHAHDLVDGAGDSLQKRPCAACVVSASPGLVLERADVAPRFEPVDVVSADDAAVVALSFAVRPGRAPPAV